MEPARVDDGGSGDEERREFFGRAVQCDGENRARGVGEEPVAGRRDKEAHQAAPRLPPARRLSPFSGAAAL